MINPSNQKSSQSQLPLLLVFLSLLNLFNLFNLSPFLPQPRLFSETPHSKPPPPHPQKISEYLQNTPNLVEPIPHDNPSSLSNLQYLLQSTPNYFSIPNPQNQNQYWKKKYLQLLQTLQFYSDQSIFNPQFYSHNLQHDNLFIVLYDLVTPQKDYNSYAKIYLNRQLLGQTNQALRSQKKIFKTKIKPNVRHLLTIEKYFLNSLKKKWERFKNLLQPKPKYFKIPQNQIRIVKIIYDSSKENSQNAHLKYQYSSFLISDLSKIFDDP